MFNPVGAATWRRCAATMQGSDTGRRRGWLCVIAPLGLLVALVVANQTAPARAAAVHLVLAGSRRACRLRADGAI